MTNRDARRDPRLQEPIDARLPGVFPLPLTLYDLSLSGCFITSVHDLPECGRVFAIEIDLSHEGTIEAQVESVYVRPGYGCGARFRAMSEETRRKLEREVTRLLQGA